MLFYMATVDGATAIEHLAASVDRLANAMQAPTQFALKDYATAISIFVTSLLAVVVTWLHNRYQKAINRKEAHAELRLKAIDVHAEFWNSSEMAAARRLISSEPEYHKLKISLDSRLAATECTLGAEGYQHLELVDRFYSAVMRLRRLEVSLAAFGSDKESELMIRECYGYWVEILQRQADKPGDRESLKEYLTRFWPGIVGCLPAGETYGALAEGTNKAVNPSGGSGVIE